MSSTQLSLIPEDKPAKRRKLPIKLSKKELAPLLRFDQHDYCNATAWISWFNPHRENLGLPKKRFREFKRYVGQNRIEEMATFMGECGTPINLQIFRSGLTRHTGTWLPRSLMPDFLTWLSADGDTPLHLFFNSGQWSKWESRVFTGPDNVILPPAPPEMQAEAGELYRQLCDQLEEWRTANPGASSCKGGQLFNVYVGYTTKALFRRNLTQLKQLLMLRPKDNLHAHLPELLLKPLTDAYMDAISSITPALVKDALKQAMSSAGARVTLTGEARLLLAA